MAVHIEGQGREIHKGTYGKDIRGPISDALWILYNHGLRATAKKLVTQEEYDAIEVKEQNVAYCIYDPTEPVWKDYWISVIMLDGDADTDDVFYCKTLVEARAKLDEYYENDPDAMYRIWIGEECGVTTVPARTFQSCPNIVAFHVPGTITNIREYAFSQSAIRHVTYTESDTTLYVDRYAFYITNLRHASIPNRCHTSSIRGYEYGQNQYLETVEFGNSLTTISNGMFNSCRVLDNVSFSDSITTIETDAFYNCRSLTTVNLNNVRYIGQTAFKSCTVLKNIDLSDVYTIQYYAFNQCAALERVEFAHLSLMGEGAFATCATLATVVFHPNSQVSIPANAFNNCYKLKIVVFQNEKRFISIGASAFYFCLELENIDIPDCVRTIGNSAFAACRKLTTVTLSNSLTTLGDSAFDGCELLNDLTLPDTLTSIGRNAFFNCRSFLTLDLPKNLQTIPVGMCEYCTSLESISIPKGIASIGGAAFHYCTSLTTIMIPNGPTSIGSNAFQDCHSLKSITIGNTVEQIFDDPTAISGLPHGQSGAFSACPNLRSITIYRSEGSVVDANGDPWMPLSYRDKYGDPYLPEDCEIHWRGSEG